MTRLQDLYDIGGQSPWLDNLRRDWLEDGQLADLVALGVRGITSNPTIFANAISGQDTYDDQFRALMKDHTVESAYWEMAITDIEDAAEDAAPALRRERRRGRLRLAGGLPRAGPRHRGTVHDARMLHERIDQPNLLVKVPATREGVPAIETLIGEGRSINVTLIFGLDRYDEVMEAYLRGLEALVAAGRDAELAKVASVASFFVSRVDTEVDRRLETLAGGEKGDAAVLGSARHGRGGPGPDGLPALPSHLRRRALGGAAGPRCPGAAAAVGVDVDQEPRLLRPALRRQPDRAGHGEHHAGADPAGLRATTGPCTGRSTPTRTPPPPSWPAWPTPGSTCSTWSRRWRTRASIPSPSPSTSCCSRSATRPLPSDRRHNREERA